VRVERIAATAAGALALAAAAAPASAATPARIGGHAGFWPLSRLGLHAPVRITAPGTRVVARYGLGAGTRQGAPLWYTIRLHVAFRFSRTPGECVVSAATNGMTGAQVIVRTGRRAAVVSSLGWIQGRRRARVTAPTAHLDFRNYLQLQGVRPGLNTFTVTEDVLRGRCFESVSLLPDSGVGATSVRPDELRLLVPSAPVVAVAGRRTRLRFAVARRGGRPDGGFDVAVTLPPGVTAAGGRTRHLDRIGRLASGSFDLVATRPGRYVLSLSVPRRYNQPSANVEVDVVRPRPWLRTHFLPSLVAATFLVGAAAFMRATRKRTRPA